MSKGKREEKEYRVVANKGGKMNIVFKILAFVYFAITVVFCMAVINMDMIPNLYLYIFLGAEAIFTVLMVLGLGKRHKTFKLNIFCLIIAIIVSVCYIQATRYIVATMDFLGDTFSCITETEEYYVVVRKDSKYSSIEELEDSIYSFQIEDEIKDKLIENTIEETYSLEQLGEDLTNEKIEAILVSSPQYDILDEEMEGFKENTKIIHKVDKDVEVTPKEEDKDNKYTIKNGTFNVYISGIDTQGSIKNVARTDANMILTVNTKTHEVLLTSIPRDYYVTLHSKGAKDKLTHSGIYGINETVSTVEDLLDIDINYYVRVNFTTVTKIIDALGGIEVYSDYNFRSKIGGYYFYKGYNYVYGEKALAFSRERKSFNSGDHQRVKNQQHVIEAVIKKVMNSKTILTKYTSILNSLSGSFQTNVEQEEISKLVKNQLEKMPSWKIKNNSLTGSGASSSTYSTGRQKAYVMIPDSTSVQEAKEQIQSVLGE